MSLDQTIAAASPSASTNGAPVSPELFFFLEAAGAFSGEESGTQDKSERSVEDRLNLECSDQAFFNQKGFVTDSMPEVDASQELLRTQKEAKVRNREDQIKRGSLD